MQLTKTTKYTYNNMLGVLPPAAVSHGRFAGGDTFSCFLVGEPTKHNKQGHPLYTSYFTSDDKYYRGNDMTTTELYQIANADLEAIENAIANSEEPADDSEDARILEAIELNGEDITEAYAYIHGWEYVTADSVSDSFAGEYDSHEAFARDMAENIDAIKDYAQWPYTCIDWEHAARELMYDYSEHNSFYFRND